jgi:hypothetical protein
MYEHHRAPLLPKARFVRRLARSAGLAGAIVFGSLGLGVAGYHVFGRLSWIDSLVNAAMILTGMGPVDPIASWDGKLFAVGYALFSGVAFLTIIAVLFAPLIHRFLHRFHLDLADEGSGDRRGTR